MFKSPLIVILIALLVVSLLGNYLLLNQAIKYYKMFKIAKVYPLNNGYYTNENKQLVWSKDTKRVILFGDSRIKEWIKLPELKGFQFINRGISGETTAQMKERFKADVILLKPDIVIIQAGINDIVAAAQIKTETTKILEQCVSNVNYFISTLLQQNVKVILTTIIPPASPGLSRWMVWDDSISSNVNRLNLTWLTINQKGLYVLDTGKLLTNKNGEWLPEVNRDTLHITRSGYTIINKALNNLLTDKQNAF